MHLRCIAATVGSCYHFVAVPTQRYLLIDNQQQRMMRIKMLEAIVMYFKETFSQPDTISQHSNLTINISDTRVKISGNGVDIIFSPSEFLDVIHTAKIMGYE
jgi:hypothetical protein